MTSWSAALETVPQRAFARIASVRASRLPRLEAAFAGPGAPDGILAIRKDSSSLLVEFDASRTPVALVAAIAAAETCDYPAAPAGRHWPADDASLTALCSDLLAEPNLDTSRLIETYLIPMLNESA